MGGKREDKCRDRCRDRYEQSGEEKELCFENTMVNSEQSRKRGGETGEMRRSEEKMMKRRLVDS